MSIIDIFNRKKNSELEGIIISLNANMSNNYKDNAQSNFLELCNKYEELIKQNKLNEKQIAYYEQVISELKEQLTGYTHKDQKPYWT